MLISNGGDAPSNKPALAERAPPSRRELCLAGMEAKLLLDRRPGPSAPCHVEANAESREPSTQASPIWPFGAASRGGERPAADVVGQTSPSRARMRRRRVWPKGACGCAISPVEARGLDFLTPHDRHRDGGRKWRIGAARSCAARPRVRRIRRSFTFRRNRFPEARGRASLEVQSSFSVASFFGISRFVMMLSTPYSRLTSRSLRFNVSKRASAAKARFAYPPTGGFCLNVPVSCGSPGSVSGGEGDPKRLPSKGRSR